MTFPTIQTTSQGSNVAGTSHPITLPSGITSGDLLLVFFGTDGDNTITNWQTFTELDQQKDTKDIFGAVGYKIAAGSDTLTITTSVSEPSRYICYRIDGWEDTFAPEISTYIYGTNDSPNSDSVTTSWTQDDTLWISTCMCDNNSVVSAYPTNYILSQLNQTGGNQDCGVGVAGRNLNAASEDPPTYTLDDAEQWFAWTIAVAPSGAAGETTAYKDIALKTTLESALTYKDVTLKTTLDILDYKDIALKTTLESIPTYKDITLKTTLHSLNYKDVAIKTSLESEAITAYKDVTLKTTLESIPTYKDITLKTSLESILTYKDIAIKTSLEAFGETTDYKDITLKTSLESATTYKDITLKTSLDSLDYKDVTLKTSLDSLNYKDITLKTTLESVNTYKDVSVKVSLESVPIYKDISVKTSLESANIYKDINLKTSLDSLNYKDVALKTSFTVTIVAAYKDISIKVSLESRPTEIINFISTITQTEDLISTITQTEDLISTITQTENFTSNINTE